MKTSDVMIPAGVGFSKRIFIAMVVVLSVITILFVYFINRYSTHKEVVHNQAQGKVIVSESDVDNVIGKIEANKYKPSSVSESVSVSVKKGTDNVKAVTKSKALLSDDAFKSASESQLSVYTGHNNSTSFSETPMSNNSNVSSEITGQASASQPDKYDQQNGQDQKIAFLNSNTKNQDTIDSQLKTPISKFEVMAGTIIPATLVTGIDSDLPGTITAKVSRDVFDTPTGNYLLIPQGTTIIGSYDSRVSYGQSRALIAWQRLIFPNGDSFDLNGMPGADLMGIAGISDLVNHHYARIFGSALMMSVFGSAGQLSQPRDTNGNQISDAQIIYAAVGEQMSQTSAQLIAKNMDIQPTITIRPGANFNVLLTRDMVLPTYYHFS